MGTVSAAAALPAEAGTESEYRPDAKQGQNQKLHKGTSFLRQDQENVIDQEGHHPGDDALACRHTGSLPAGAKLPLDCGDSGHAGGVEQSAMGLSRDKITVRVYEGYIGKGHKEPDPLRAG